MISFVTTRDEFALIGKIADRALAEYRDRLHPEGIDRQWLVMDLSATHANGCPLDFGKMLGFDDFNFAHDLFGIINCLDRETGELRNNFVPRCALPKNVEVV